MVRISGLISQQGYPTRVLEGISMAQPNTMRFGILILSKRNTPLFHPILSTIIHTHFIKIKIANLILSMINY
jgi:hypothetical protein